MKLCPQCKEVKERAEFYRKSTTKDGFRSVCKKCTDIKTKEYAHKNIERLRAYSTKHRRERRIRDPERVKAQEKNVALKRQFGLTYEEYKVLLEQQNNCCAICTRPQTDFPKSLAVDHCHVSGVIRGLLCANCNVALGQFRDDPKLLLSAISYLKRA